MATIPELLDGHITLEVECLDRLYLNGYIGRLATGIELSMFMRNQLGKPVPSPACATSWASRSHRRWYWDRCPRSSARPLKRLGLGLIGTLLAQVGRRALASRIANHGPGFQRLFNLHCKRAKRGFRRTCRSKSASKRATVRRATGSRRSEGSPNRYCAICGRLLLDDFQHPQRVVLD